MKKSRKTILIEQKTSIMGNIYSGSVFLVIGLVFVLGGLARFIQYLTIEYIGIMLLSIPCFVYGIYAIKSSIVKIKKINEELELCDNEQ